MTELTRKNARRFTDWTPPAAVQAFRDSQFDQRQPLWPSGTAGVGRPIGRLLFPNDGTGAYSFDSCNLINCEPPTGSAVTTCNTALIERDVFVRIASEEDVLAKLAQYVGGNVYGVRVWGRWTPSGYEYFTAEGVTPDTQL